MSRLLMYYLDELYCDNYGDYICNLPYACDSCPYNFEIKVEERLLIGL
jgi:hypothetical protein